MPIFTSENFENTVWAFSLSFTSSFLLLINDLQILSKIKNKTLSEDMSIGKMEETLFFSKLV
jgi:hypothetical protein